jgi:ElaB/YqjD/DUF883 family membrane-anchored ribosome-binding protein
MTPLDIAIRAFEQLARDLGRSRIDGNPIAVAAELRTILGEIEPLLAADGTYTARAAKAVRAAEFQEELAKTRKLYAMTSAEAERLTHERREAARTPIRMEPWLDVVTS